MPAYTEILRSLPAEKFSEILGASSRKSREVYFHRHNVRAAAQVSRMPKPGAKNEQRTAALYEVLKERDDDQLAEEIIRTWLLSKRTMLAAALDHLGIRHDNGLTDSDDVSKIEKLSVRELKGLVKALEKFAAPHEIAVYLKFMGAEKAEEAISA